MIVVIIYLMAFLVMMLSYIFIGIAWLEQSKRTTGTFIYGVLMSALYSAVGGSLAILFTGPSSIALMLVLMMGIFCGGVALLSVAGEKGKIEEKSEEKPKKETEEKSLNYEREEDEEKLNP